MIAMCQLSQLNSISLKLLRMALLAIMLLSTKVAAKILNAMGIKKVLEKGSTVYYMIVLLLYHHDISV